MGRRSPILQRGDRGEAPRPIFGSFLLVEKGTPGRAGRIYRDPRAAAKTDPLRLGVGLLFCCCSGARPDFGLPGRGFLSGPTERNQRLAEGLPLGLPFIGWGFVAPYPPIASGGYIGASYWVGPRQMPPIQLCQEERRRHLTRSAERATLGGTFQSTFSARLAARLRRNENAP